MASLTDSTTDSDPREASRCAFVFAPSPLLTVTIEEAPDNGHELHIHAGGQGFWIGRMAAILGMDVHLCGPFGGEAGRILVDLMTRENVTVHPVETASENGSYVHDRRGGARTVVVEVPPPALTRHETDDLFSTSLAAALAADIAILGGPHCDHAVPTEVYRRLCADLTALAIPVVADLSGSALTAALSGGVTVLKVSHEDLIEDGRAQSDDIGELVTTMHRLHEEGAETVIVSRAGDPAIALCEGEVWEVETPPVQIVDHHGAGDSMTAGFAAAFSTGKSLLEALRLGAAAGAVNVTRRGLATGHSLAVARMTDKIQVRRMQGAQR
ncbi:phosphofructokinase [Rhodococcus sp. HNM0563]|uniref:PfkB family carbohydrate kinase n=1 Tax=Rhodococcus sp. HNM0563 TaxID=2716339 RepID=UPI001469C55F|nr:PfkB family carbohydrate kinase [Rhodococcus sp. HNM0563]MCK0090183.1 PfkB family carbohydrate kinase [Rhodococcus sp. F64268]NLU64710.1 phosphofructokinase [Rhodococcus sp. HNM0563]